MSSEPKQRSRSSPQGDATVVVPTKREADSLPLLVERLAGVRERRGLDLRLLVMDDDSRDGTVEWARSTPDWVELVVRTRDHGLSAAVLDGVRRAETETVVVMDADLSHPPETIPELLARLDEGCDFVVGSRYAAGGATDEAWTLLRAVNSRVATALARPLTSIRDPMSGFFAFRRRLLERAERLDPIGYKIGLEILVRCRAERVAEVPIRFAVREHGESKLGLTEQVRYLRHLGRLYRFRYLG